jgi:TrpR-related protein YerC/YecD
MKRRHIDPADGCDPEELLLRALAVLDGPAELRAFLRDLCTPAELEALRDRWRVVPHLMRGMAYREIHELTGVSVTTIGRVARFLAEGNGGYRVAAQRLFGDSAAPVANAATVQRGPQSPTRPSQVTPAANADPVASLNPSNPAPAGNPSTRP